jgi:hypothetical protein
LVATEARKGRRYDIGKWKSKDRKAEDQKAVLQ